MRLLTIFKRFFLFGCVAFGGPMAHIAMMQNELVDKDKWVDEATFMDWIGMTQLIPGPNSTEMVMHMGYHRGGILGLFAAGAGFILPSFSITLGLTMLYHSTSDFAGMEMVLWAIKPTVLAIIVMAVYQLGKKTLKTPRGYGLSALALAAGLTGMSPILIILGVGILSLSMRFLPLTKNLNTSGAGGIFTLILSSPNHHLFQIFWPFFKIGAVLYGGGYVLTAFAQQIIVDDLGLLTSGQLLDAIFIGQLTPGPILTAATSMGYMMGGISGAALATLGIFLPSFFFVLILHPIIPKLRKNIYTAAFLDGVNAAALGLMVSVCFAFFMGILSAPILWLLFGASMVWLVKKPFGYGALPLLAVISLIALGISGV